MGTNCAACVQMVKRPLRRKVKIPIAALHFGGTLGDVQYASPGTKSANVDYSERSIMAVTTRGR